MRLKYRFSSLLSQLYYKVALCVFMAAFFFSTAPWLILPVHANAEFKTHSIGMHILHPSELEQVAAVLDPLSSEDEWHYVTIPFSLADREKKAEWQQFFLRARELRIIPLVRLVTAYSPEKKAWEKPTHKDIAAQISFLAELEWPTDKRHIIIFNEVNHAKEWGGELDPAEYARFLRFASSWAQSESSEFVILPAGMDLAAPNSAVTREAFAYLTDMLAADPEIFEMIDVWNSHSYPNPGFSSAPTRTSKNSLRGFVHELAFITEKTGLELSVMITETGWESTPALDKLLVSYYSYALEHIWSDDRVLAVTPFLFRGSPGPFSGFSFVDEHGATTRQYYALKQAVLKQETEEKALASQQ